MLLNNAGFAENLGKRIVDIPLENYRKMTDVNLNGAWYTLKYVLQPYIS